MMDTNGEGSRLNADYFKWIHGFSRKKTRLEQCFGWVPVRSLDDKAVAASVRVLEDALMHKGLLLRSVRQLVLNWEHSGAVRQKARIWCGLLPARAGGLATIPDPAVWRIVLDRRLSVTAARGSSS